MKKSRLSLYLFLLFAFILAVKIGLSFLMSGTFLYSDEACVIRKAIHFIEYFEIKTCSSITHAPAGDPLFFQSIFISPVYLFLRGINAYYGVLILHSLVVSSLVYPLFKIFQRFGVKDWKTFLYIPVILFLPHIVIYEKMVATEALYVVLNIWMLHFYLESFFAKKRNKKIKLKIVSFTLALLATLVRPFGLMTFMALAFNEFIISKKRKKLLMIIIPIFLITFAYIVFYHISYFGTLYTRIFDLTDPNKLLLMLIAIKNQINSYLVITALVPCLVFFGFIFSKKIKHIEKIRWFLLALIFINFAISANHMYGYLVKGIELHLIERYINLTGVLIIMFSFIFLEKEKQYILNLKNIIISGICIVCLFFLNYTMTKHALNLGLSVFFDTSTFISKNRPPSTTFLAYYFIPILFVLYLLLLMNKKRILAIVISLCFLAYSTALFMWEIEFSHISQENNVYHYFQESNLNILYIISYKEKRVPYAYWRMQALTDNNVDARYLNDKLGAPELPNFQSEKAKEFLSNYDYIITKFELPALTPLNIPSASERVYKINHD